MIIVGTNSYVTEAELSEYALQRGITISGDTEMLLIKAMDFLEIKKYKGSKTSISQTLEFPRTVTYAYSAFLTTDSDYIDPDVVPTKIKTAQIVASLLIDAGNDLLANVERVTKREKVDVIEVEYDVQSIATTSYTQLNDLLRPYLSNTQYGTKRI